MNRFGATEFTGAVTLDFAAAAANQPVRLGELQALLSGKANLGGTFTYDNILDQPAKLVLRLAENIVPTPDLTWQVSGALLSGTVNLAPGGGLLHTAAGIKVDFSGVMAVGSSITSAQITDFDAAFNVQLGEQTGDTNTIYWQRGAILSANVRLNPTGALMQDASGVAVNLGTGHGQAAYGDHTHSQLHNPLTLGSNYSLALELAGQNLTGEVQLAPGSGLKITPAGLMLDFGYGPNQVASGQYCAMLSGQGNAKFTTANSPSLILGYSNNVLSGAVRADPSPPPGYGAIGINGGGISVMLGTTPGTAAAGNHTHAVATESSDGFMSAADKRTLDLLSGGGTAATPMQQVLFTREGAMISGQYLTGQYYWDADMTAKDAQLYCLAPQMTTLVTLEIGGALTGITMTVNPASNGTPVNASISIGLDIPPGQLVRWKITGGPADSSTAGTQCGLVARVV